MPYHNQGVICGWGIKDPGSTEESKEGKKDNGK